MSKPGEIEVWGDFALASSRIVPPGGNFRMIAPGGFSQSLAIGMDGKLVLWGERDAKTGKIEELKDNVKNDAFIDAAITPTMVIAIRADTHEVEVHGQFSQPLPIGLTDAAVPGRLKGMKALGVAAGGSYAVVIDMADQRLHHFGPDVPPFPPGKFTQIRARHGYTIGLDETGNLYGWGSYFKYPAPFPAGKADPNPFPEFWESNPYLADDVIVTSRAAYSVPSWRGDIHGHWFVPGPFVDLAAGVRETDIDSLPHILALRPDGMVVGWGGNNFNQAQAPNGLKFLAIAAGKGFSVGITKNSELRHWGQGGAILKAPPGEFQSIGAAVTHATAVGGKLQFVKKVDERSVGKPGSVKAVNEVKRVDDK